MRAADDREAAQYWGICSLDNPTQQYYILAKSLGSCVLDARLDLNSRKLERAGIRQRIDMCVQNA